MSKVIPKLSALALPWPTDWSALFDAPGDQLLVEIGFGYGHTLRHLTRLYPTANIVGMEISNECLVKAEKAIARGELPNVRVLFARAETALYHCFAPASIDALYINFPDPWFKSRHERRRLMQRPTVDTIANRLKPGARVYLATDILAYAEMSAELLAETPGLVNIFETPWVERWPDDMPPRATTKYEGRALKEGRTCYYFAYQRLESGVPDVPVLQDLPMPHQVIATPLPLNTIRSEFTPLDFSEGEIHVNVTYVFESDKSLLFEAFVHEPTIEQRIGIVLVSDPANNDYTLRLSQIGNPRPTEGMHVAVRRLGEWLIGLHPNAHIVHDRVRQLD